MQRRLHACRATHSAGHSWVRLRRDPESKSGIFPVRLRNNHVAIFLTRRKLRPREPAFVTMLPPWASHAAAPAVVPAPRTAWSMFAGAAQHVILLDGEK
jgi:hypothetical protein